MMPQINTIEYKKIEDTIRDQTHECAMRILSNLEEVCAKENPENSAQIYEAIGYHREKLIATLQVKERETTAEVAARLGKKPAAENITREVLKCRPHTDLQRALLSMLLASKDSTPELLVKVLMECELDNDAQVELAQKLSGTIGTPALIKILSKKDLCDNAADILISQITSTPIFISIIKESQVRLEFRKISADHLISRGGSKAKIKDIIFYIGARDPELFEFLVETATLRFPELKDWLVETAGIYYLPNTARGARMQEAAIAGAKAGKLFRTLTNQWNFQQPGHKDAQVEAAE
jgi:hypothetical protein